MNNSDMETRIRQSLDQQGLDDSTLSQLDAARRHALDQRSPRRHGRWFAPAIAIASLAVVAVAITLSLPGTTPPEGIDSIAAFEILTSDEELELYRDLEFYVWLDGNWH